MCKIGRGRVINKKEIEANLGEFPVYSSQTSNNGIFGYLNTYDFEGEYVTWTTDGIYAGSVFYRNGKFNCTNVCGTLRVQDDAVNMKYLALILPIYTGDYVIKVANPKLMNNVMAEIKIPLPQKEIQEKIVQEIEALEKQEADNKEKIEALKESIQNISSKSKWPMVKLGEVVNFLPKSKRAASYGQEIGLHPFFTSSSLQNKYVDKPDYTQESLIIGDGGLSSIHIHHNFSVSDHNFILQAEPKKALNKYLYFVLKGNFELISVGLQGANLKNVSKGHLKDIQIPLPPKEIQEKIVQEITTIEEEIVTLQADIKEAKKQKEAVLKKYL